MSSSELQLPLFQFPPDAQIAVTKCLEVMDLISLSFCSKRCKRLVISTKCKASRLSLMFYHNYSISIVFPEEAPLEIMFYSEDHYQMRTISKPGHISVSLMGMPGRSYKRDNFELKDWISHISSVINDSEIEELNITTDHFSAKSIKEALTGLEWKSLVIERRCPPIHCQDCMETLLPRILSFSYTEPANSGRILAQNSEGLTICSSLRMKLDDLLNLNALHGHFKEAILTGLDLKKFLKCWISGSNFRIKHIRIEKNGVDATWNSNTVLQGVEYTRMGEDEIRNYRKYEYENNIGQLVNQECRNGFDISRIEKIEATISFSVVDNKSRFDMIVWD